MHFDNETEKRLQEIKDHFANISVEQFEKNLIEAGIETIKPASESGYEMVTTKEYFKEVSEKIDNLSDKEFEDLMIKVGADS